MTERLGAAPAGGRCRFEVWAPYHAGVEVHLLAPRERLVRMEPGEGGYHTAVVEGVEPGALYRYRLGGGVERADPASRSQPQGVHGPSEVIAAEFAWSAAAWRGVALADYVMYELHVGVYTPEGTFGAIVPHLAELRDLGVTALALMPVAQFPGARNWGYDGVYPFAAQGCYGGAGGLKRLVDACHLHGIAVVLDVVYNHLGPEGNYFRDFGPYFTDRYRTPWGEAINFDSAGSDEVRRYFIENALYWIDECRVDALRLDAVHAIYDFSAQPFLKELGEAVHARAAQLGRAVHLIAESDLNDSRVVRPAAEGGLGLDAQWSDDFHHALRCVLTDERRGYYADFGEFGQLAAAFRGGYVYTGQYSRWRQRRHGNSTRGIPPERFVVFTQNHDQTGNRMLGERLSSLAPFQSLKLASAAALLSPFLPMLFMGQEYAETAPFLYFVEHSDADLVEAVRKGRREEFAAFAWQGVAPDPQAEETFARSKLDHGLKEQPPHRAMREWHREVLRLRGERRRGEWRVVEAPQRRALALLWPDWLLALNFDARGAELELPAGPWRKALDSEDERWLGSGESPPCRFGGGVLAIAPRTCVCYVRSEER